MHCINRDWYVSSLRLSLLLLILEAACDPGLVKAFIFQDFIAFEDQMQDVKEMNEGILLHWVFVDYLVDKSTAFYVLFPVDREKYITSDVLIGNSRFLTIYLMAENDSIFLNAYKHTSVAFI